MTDFYNMEPMKYWSKPSTMSDSDFNERLNMCIASKKYLCAEKFDGNFSRAIIDKNNLSVLQTRGISKKTGTYGEIQEKVLWWGDVVKAFNDTTVILGEIYLPQGIDRDVGSITRSLPARAIKLQKETQPLQWRIFDVLAYEGTDLMKTPFSKRISFIPEIVKKINNPLIQGIQYYEMDDTFFNKLNEVFENGGEGMVATVKDMIYIPKKRGPHAWDTIKIKQELEHEADVFITRLEPAIQEYTGKDIAGWPYWENIRTGEKFYGNYYKQYREGQTLLPITKGWYNGWPGSIYCGVYNSAGEIIEICKVSGLTDEMKESMKNDFDKWKMTCLTIGGMQLSKIGDNYSIRHPRIKKLRYEDLDPKDCLLSKIVG